MRKRSTILSLLPALAVSWLLWAPPSQAQAEDEATAAPETGEASQAGDEGDAEASKALRKERAQQRREQNIARAIENAWWHRADLVEALSLSEATRTKMDGLYQSYLEAREKGSEVADRRMAFVESLSKGDWKQARKRLDEVVAESGAPVRAQGEFKIEVLSLLSEEQLAKLAEDDIEVLRRPWVGSRRTGVGPGRAGRRPRRR